MSDNIKKENTYDELPPKLKKAIDELIMVIKIYGPQMSVTERAKDIEQPRGGYVKRVDFEEKPLGPGEEVLHEDENVHASLIGMAVDYLTRFILTDDVEDAFKISILKKINEIRTANRLIKGINGLDDQSIINAIKLSGFDVIYRGNIFGYVPVNTIKPNVNTVDNVRVMVQRTVNFFEQYGPIVSDGFSFEGGYTKIIADGDADYLSADTLWDLKVLKNHFNKNHIMQLLIYWRMGLRSDYEKFKKIKYIGIYNPRKNKVFIYDLCKLPYETIQIIDEVVIGYTKPSLIYF